MVDDDKVGEGVDVVNDELEKLVQVIEFEEEEEDGDEDHVFNDVWKPF